MAFWRSARAGSSQPAAETLEIGLTGLDRPVAIRRSRRARRLSLRINEAKRSAVLTIPVRVSTREASDFLARHVDWLRSRLANLPEPVPFVTGARLPFRGNEHTLRISPSANGWRKVWLEKTARPSDLSREHEELDLVDLISADMHKEATIIVQGPQSKVASRLTTWLKAEARHDLDARVAHHAARLAVEPARITVRDQTTRWGSCSASGALSFSWRLVLAPSFVLDYVAAHEVAHLRELNHGPRFWQLVKENVPRLDEARAWLKADGPRLHQYGAGQ